MPRSLILASLLLLLRHAAGLAGPSDSPAMLMGYTQLRLTNVADGEAAMHAHWQPLTLEQYRKGILRAV